MDTLNTKYGTLTVFRFSRSTGGVKQTDIRADQIVGYGTDPGISTTTTGMCGALSDRIEATRIFVKGGKSYKVFARREKVQEMYTKALRHGTSSTIPIPQDMRNYLVSQGVRDIPEVQTVRRAPGATLKVDPSTTRSVVSQPS